VGRKLRNRVYGGSLRKRRMALGGNSFSLYQPALNLSEEEYNRRLEEIKKMGNMR